MGAGCPAGAMVGIRRSPRPSNTGNQIEQVQNREEYLRGVVSSIDGSLEQSFNQMVSSMNTYFGELRNRSSSELDTVRQAYEQQQRAFVQKLQEQQEAVSVKTEELSRILQGLQSLSDIRSAFSSLANVSKENSRKLEQIAQVLSSMGGSSYTQYVSEESGHGKKKRKFSLQGFLNNAIKVAALIAFILFVVQFVANIIAK